MYIAHLLHIDDPHRLFRWMPNASIADCRPGHVRRAPVSATTEVTVRTATGQELRIAAIPLRQRRQPQGHTRDRKSALGHLKDLVPSGKVRCPLGIATSVPYPVEGQLNPEWSRPTR
jgi:hypothetical protein